MEKKTYITEEERAKCQKVADVGRYGFVMLKYYTPPHGFEEDETFTDSKALFEALWQEWIHTTLYLIAKEMQLEDILYEEIFNLLSKEKQSAIIGRKSDFAQKAEISLKNKF
ncbi:hypothetical protein IMSAGC009_04387 [Lachnospiraceae bacterium]|nr:hypothetical protein IMSAGC009_04387 [Lachnospiraceae bacterium]